MAGLNLSDDQKSSIVELFFFRVLAADKRRKIVQLSAVLADNDLTSDTFYASVYHYSLTENWQSLEKDFESLNVPALLGDHLVDFSSDVPRDEKFTPPRRTNRRRKKRA